MQIKFKVLKVVPNQAGIDVHYYTDELETAAQPQREAFRQHLRANFHVESQQWEDERVLREHPGGLILHVTFHDGVVPPVDQLQQYILDRAPVEYLTLKHKLVTEGPADLSALQSLVGVEQQGVPTQLAIKQQQEQVQNQLLEFLDKPPAQ